MTRPMINIKEIATYGLIFAMSFTAGRIIEGTGPFFDGSFLFFFLFCFLLLFKLKSIRESKKFFGYFDVVVFPIYLSLILFLWWWLRRWGVAFSIAGSVGFFIWLHHIAYRLSEKNAAK